MNIFKGYDLDQLERKPIKELAGLSKKAAIEGIVLLKNEDVLPFDRKKILSVFGRTQIDYVKSGTGSGGLVNTEYSVTILDGLSGKIKINEDLLKTYKDWILENPFDNGPGWAQEPWSQKEMPVSDELCKKASEASDYALIVIGRTSGEDRDNNNEQGSYLLTDDEENLIKTVRKYFDKVCVALNTGNIIDMKWVEKYNIPCVLYCWQGGQEGGNAFAEVVLGNVSPSGRLTDTIAYDIEDYPSTKNHGNPLKCIYQEDIYIGYRYFETFNKDRVLFPFGYGLSYTCFDIEYKVEYDDTVKVSAVVENTGTGTGKTVVQVYFSAPSVKIGTPERQLISYKKTKELKPGEKESIFMEFAAEEMSAYDDKSFAYILEGGEYKLYAGENVRDAKLVCSLDIKEKIICECRQTLAPIEGFDRLVKNPDGSMAWEAVPIRKYDILQRINEHVKEEMSCTGDKGIMLVDVKNGKNTLDEFVLQLSDEELTYLVKGEGMNSPRVTGGTGSAFGGVCDELLAYGIPAVCCSDGPSGIRMDTGHVATLIPNGTCLASTWNDELVEEIHTYIGIELRANDIDVLLAPGINIHRNPLCGRNFEYYSEDPYLTGKIAAAATRGLKNAGVAGSVKHFACNSQEKGRHKIDACVSERALREIYLKPFEIAVKEGETSVIMTSYNCINGEHTATNYDLVTSILRDEWGYRGIVITDWWSNLGAPDTENKTDISKMVKAQNDIYMVVSSSKNNKDDLIDAIPDKYYLRTCAKNILNFILTSPAFSRKPQNSLSIEFDDLNEIKRISNITSGTLVEIMGAEVLEFEYSIDASEFAQYSINVYSDEKHIGCAIVSGTNGKKKSTRVKVNEYDKPLKVEFAKKVNLMDLIAYSR